MWWIWLHCQLWDCFETSYNHEAFKHKLTRESQRFCLGQFSPPFSRFWREIRQLSMLYAEVSLKEVKCKYWTCKYESNNTNEMAQHISKKHAVDEWEYDAAEGLFVLCHWLEEMIQKVPRDLGCADHLLCHLRRLTVQIWPALADCHWPDIWTVGCNSLSEKVSVAECLL